MLPTDQPRGEAGDGQRRDDHQVDLRDGGYLTVLRGYWASTEHLGLDDDGVLWRLAGPESDGVDQKLGPAASASVRDDAGEHFEEAEELWREWEDAGTRHEYQAQVVADYRRGAEL